MQNFKPGQSSLGDEIALVSDQIRYIVVSQNMWILPQSLTPK